MPAQTYIDPGSYRHCCPSGSRTPTPASAYSSPASPPPPSNKYKEAAGTAAGLTSRALPVSPHPSSSRTTPAPPSHGCGRSDRTPQTETTAQTSPAYPLQSSPAPATPDDTRRYQKSSTASPKRRH